MGFYDGRVRRKTFVRRVDFQVNDRVPVVRRKVKLVGLFDVGN